MWPVAKWDEPPVRSILVSTANHPHGPGDELVAPPLQVFGVAREFAPVVKAQHDLSQGFKVNG